MGDSEKLGTTGTLRARVLSLCMNVAHDTLITFFGRVFDSLTVRSSREGISPVRFCLQFPALCLAQSRHSEQTDGRNNWIQANIHAGESDPDLFPTYFSKVLGWTRLEIRSRKF